MSHIGATVRLLAGSCHLGPALAVTGLTTALAAGHRLPPARTLLVTTTVLAGQLAIGWGNDLVDAERDRTTGRPGKPLAAQTGSSGVVAAALGVSAAATLLLGARCGGRAGAVHTLAVVGSGAAYNLGMKATPVSVLPYAVAFGALPHVVALADPARPAPAPAWQAAAGSLLGSAAHLLDALPDLAIDEATGVRGLPHRLGARRVRLLAAASLAVAHSTVAAACTTRPSRALVPGAVAAVGVARGAGTVPFWCAAGLAGVDVALIGRGAPPAVSPRATV